MSIIQQIRKLSSKSRLVASAVFVGLALMVAWQSSTTLKTKLWKRIDATVVGVIASTPAKTKVIYRFRAGEKQLVCPGLVDKNSFDFKKGQVVKVLFDPDKPESNVLESRTGYLLAYLGLIVSMLFLGAGVFLLMTVVRD